jgi:glycosyltransferase involved in cell wall biosynthesis
MRRELRIPAEKPIVLYVGRLDVDKNVEILIKAIPLITKKIAAHFVLLGEGTEKEKLQVLVKALKAQANISFLKFIDYNNRALPRIYQTSNLFVNPCPYETQSIVTLEALATGLPVVVANAGALPELVENKVNGFRFRPGDEKDLAKKIIKILQNKKLAKKMGEKSLKKVENHLVEETCDQYEKIYKNLAKKD